MALFSDRRAKSPSTRTHHISALPGLQTHFLPHAICLPHHQLVFPVVPTSTQPERLDFRISAPNHPQFTHTIFQPSQGFKITFSLTLYVYPHHQLVFPIVPTGIEPEQLDFRIGTTNCPQLAHTIFQPSQGFKLTLPLTLYVYPTTGWCFLAIPTGIKPEWLIFRSARQITLNLHTPYSSPPRSSNSLSPSYYMSIPPAAGVFSLFPPVSSPSGSIFGSMCRITPTFQPHFR